MKIQIPAVVYRLLQMPGMWLIQFKSVEVEIQAQRIMAMEIDDVQYQQEIAIARIFRL